MKMGPMGTHKSHLTINEPPLAAPNVRQPLSWEKPTQSPDVLKQFPSLCQKIYFYKTKIICTITAVHYSYISLHRKCKILRDKNKNKDTRMYLNSFGEVDIFCSVSCLHVCVPIYE